MLPEPFIQPGPQPSHPWRGDRVLRNFLAAAMPADALASMAPELEAFGDLVLELHAHQAEDRLNEPRLVSYDPWGARADRIEVTPHWKTCERVAAEHGLVATAYERKSGVFSRLHQAALIHLFHPVSEVYTCPLAMTDGAAKTLLSHGAEEDAVAHLLSRDPATFWTSGQWMTESTGGSDVGLTTTEARCKDGIWRLSGRKWFTSAAASQMALTLARPAGNAPRGKGLALFFVECRNADGSPNGYRVNRLKDKLGTRKLPTAELDLEGMTATPVAGLTDGIKAIAPMLSVTRTWNSLCAVATMRRGLDLARDYARRRVAFGSALSAKPLHLDTLAGVQAEFEGAFQLAFRASLELGREENGEADGVLLRVLAPLAKLCTAKQAVAGVSELLEAFGGAGYIEDTGLPVLLRDVQVLSIWEGTTNVLALEAWKALQAAGGLGIVKAECESAISGTAFPDAIASIRAALARAEAWWAAPEEASARGFALTLARSLELALLIRQASKDKDPRSAAAAERFTEHGVDLLRWSALEASRRLALDEI
ncbi:MAG TPA: acyl-CoA dehydrogenase family protein [Holophagaceae bacterium]|jgi:acyl-CoA dehydrogenase|nr:acyl-CoA dehydrogenase family protein [Holophagaceae bacterium]